LRVDKPIGDPFYELSEVDSTNNYAMRQVQAHMAEHGASWFALHQNSGKGQREKPWIDERGKNLILSTVIEPRHYLSVDNQFLLTVVVALACFDLFEFYAVNKTSIKWPNDIYWGDRKAGGILIENLIHGKQWTYSVVGIGININQTLFTCNLPNPVSLKQITGKTFAPADLAKELCRHLENRWQQLLQNKNDELLAAYNQHLYKLGDTATFKKDNLTFNAVVKGVNTQGELIINTGGELAAAALVFGSVKWVIP
jgi:BirA family biotin operon repressor/biotin-[acetyl-CoA-carboxylase] ligase